MSKLNIIISITIIGILLFSLLATAATLTGSIYNSKLELEQDVLIEINTTPQQKYLSKEGTYSFELPKGSYVLTAKHEEYATTEEVDIVSEEGEYLFDIFLLPDFMEEDELWNEAREELSVDSEETVSWSIKSIISYLLAGIIFVYALYRIIVARKKYGSLWKFRKRIKEEQNKSIEQHKEELAKEPGYLENALEIIKKHEGRITQKELRKEMLYLSEAKISLIVTELEHKKKVEKIKKGRGNVILLKK